jgi:hypothetical protein
LIIPLRSTSVNDVSWLATTGVNDESWLFLWEVLVVFCIKFPKWLMLRRGLTNQVIICVLI